MGKYYKVITIVVSILCIATTAYGDITPHYPVEISHQWSVAADQPEQQSLGISGSYNNSTLLDFPSKPYGMVDNQLPNKALSSTIVLTEAQGSASMCLYALLGIGTFSTARRFKKYDFGAVPEWYHLGSPGQLGYSHAISPDFLLRTSLVCCFIHQDTMTGDNRPVSQYHRETLVTLWRVSQSILEARTSRGPPCRFC